MSLGWVNWSLEILRLLRDIGRHLGTLNFLMLEIEVGTLTIVLEFAYRRHRSSLWKESAVA
jgi:hypothetical protein